MLPFEFLVFEVYLGFLPQGPSSPLLNLVLQTLDLLLETRDLRILKLELSSVGPLHDVIVGGVELVVEGLKLVLEGVSVLHHSPVAILPNLSLALDAFLE